MARKKRGAYATDMTDLQWALIAPLIPEAEPGGRPRKASRRELVNAILYFLRAGMAWRLLPHDLPPWQTVYYYLRRWQRDGVWDRVHHALVMADRERVGREASPSAASSTANRSERPIKKGIEGLRRGQEDQRPQAPHPDRYRWTAARRQGPFRRHPGPRWRQGGAQGLPRTLSLRDPRLRRWRLCRAARALGQGQGPHHRRGRQTQPSRQGLRGAAPPLGRRTNLRLDPQE